MFVPYTPGGELARRLKEVETQLGKLTGARIKIVEKVGTKLVDMLHQADPWQGMDCQREKCLICSTKLKTERDRRKDCTKRNVVYETWCLNCERTEEEKIGDGEDDDKIIRERRENIKKYKYIGETARSAYERGLEHLRDFGEMKLDSHMLKHYMEEHEGEDMENIRDENNQRGKVSF